jgi:UDPglucose 6-dehydrogenase
MKIGICGYGFVGKATEQLKNDEIEFIIYDKNPSLCNPSNTTPKELSNCDLIFISVPTPMKKDGSCCIDIVKSAINDIRKYGDPLIVIRSTVVPGTCNSLNCYFMPEFLTEKNFIKDFINNPCWIFGLLNSDKDELFKTRITKLIGDAHAATRINSNEIEFVNNKEAELVKYFKNCYLATKVSFCNEMYSICDKLDISYNTVKDLAVKDIRITDSHTNVPGLDGKFGYGGTCFPKDVSALNTFMKDNDISSYILDATERRNLEIDRCDRDWEKNIGRSVV